MGDSAASVELAPDDVGALTYGNAGAPTYVTEGIMTAPRVQCPSPVAARQLESRGWFWVFASFAFCPCHLPVTLGLLAFLLSGTAAGALLLSHPYAAGAVITAVWLAGTWRGVRYLRAAGVRFTRASSH
jgi:hypothetical protein